MAKATAFSCHFLSHTFESFSIILTRVFCPSQHNSVIDESFYADHNGTTLASYLIHIPRVMFSSKSIPNNKFSSLVHFWRKWYISHPIEQEWCVCQLWRNPIIAIIGRKTYLRGGGFLQACQLRRNNQPTMSLIRKGYGSDLSFAVGYLNDVLKMGWSHLCHEIGSKFNTIGIWPNV